MDHVARFLTNAETAAQRNEPELAVAYLEMAIEHAPDDLAVHARAQRVRAMMGRLIDREQVAAEMGIVLSDAQVEVPTQLTPVEVETPWVRRSERSDRSVPSIDVSGYQADREAGAKRNIRASAVLSWVILLLVVGAVGYGVAYPERVSTLVTYHQWDHPMDRTQLAMAAGDWAGAEEQVDRMVDVGDPKADEAMLLLAERGLAQGQRSFGERHLQRLLRRDGVAWHVMLQVGRLLESQDSPDAEEAYARAFEANAPPESWLEIARAFERYGRRNGAISLYRMVVQNVPQDAEAATQALLSMGATVVP